MNILQANLKHLYQRKACWIINLALAGTAILAIFAAFEVESKEVIFMIFPAWMYFAAIFTTPMQIEVMTKPFSWTLPGHDRIPARFLFTAGMWISSFWAVVFLLYPASILGRLLTSMSAFCLATIIYWIGVWIVLRFPNWIGAMAFFPLALLAGNFLDVHVFFQTFLTDFWYCTVLLAPIANYIAWRSLTKPGLARKYCCKLWLGTFDAWNKEKMQQFNQARQDQKKKQTYSEDPLVDNFFLKRISHLGAMNTSNYIWGALYSFFGLMLSRKKDWIKSPITLVPVICFLGYMAAGNFLFLMPGIMVVNINLGTRSNLLISGGRKERFYSTLTLAVAIALSVTAMVTLIAAATFPLNAIMPDLTIKGVPITFNTMDLRLFVIPLVMIPITFTFALIFYKYPRLMMACVMLLFVILMQASIFVKLFAVLPEYQGPIPIAILIITCWTIFTAVLHNICKRRCLVR